LPWERQYGESRQAFRAFAIYRDMPPGHRSRDRVAARLKEEAGHPTGTERAPAWGRLTFWVERWDWVRRAEAYDADQDRIARAAFEQARMDARLSRLSVYDKIMVSGEYVMQRFQEVVQSEEIADLNLRRVKIRGVLSDGSPIETERRAITDLVGPMVPAIAEAGKGQRLDYGESTERVEQTGTLRLEHEHKDVEHFGSELDALERDLGALGLDPGTIETLQGAIIASDAGAEAGGEGEVESSEPG
ncbi:MAG: hypothetical protein Q8N51_20850, partial [Gammaproteobacteria bacterium]|nr:hypothetical protein [Gammaproteobacteria bacterium]